MVEISRVAAATPSLHWAVPPILMDNQGALGAVNKGRSPAHHLDYLLRQKAAAAFASRTRVLIPRAETARQPAELISRCLDDAGLCGLTRIGAAEA